jgi:hypothetical protein
MTDSEIVILSDSPEAATLQTVTGWVSRDGRFFGSDERSARYSGSTHGKCNTCGGVCSKSWLICQACQDSKTVEKWKEAERMPWDGTTPLYSDAYDKYFFDDGAEEFAEDEGVSLEALRLRICRPVYGRLIDTDHFSDELPEDNEGEVPDVIADAMEKLNEAIKAAGPLSWVPDKYVPTFDKKADVAQA